MNKEQLVKMTKGKGFIAALDQSGGSTPKALLGYGVDESMYSNEDEMFDMIQKMRARVMNNPAFNGQEILGAILFEKTMDAIIDNEFVPDFLWDAKRVVPFLKIDKGLADENDGVRVMKPMPELDDLLRRANERHIFGTKERSVINAANPDGIKKVVDQQFEVAKKVISYGLVPIVEPEVTISISDKAEAENILLKELKEHLAALAPEDKVILKLSIPTKANLYQPLLKDKHVVRIVALSGGYSQAEACALLKKNNEMVASFSRALLCDLRYQQNEIEFTDILKEAIDVIFEASTIKE